MVGIVVVSHSPKLAEGVVELARQMGGEDVALEPVGGLDLPDHPIGTDAVLVFGAIERAWSEDGVLVLMDLGSAVLSAEMAVEMLPAERRDRVLLCEAPLVEGAVAAAVAARLERPLSEVADEARGALAPKAEHLGTTEVAPAAIAAPSPTAPMSSPAATVRLLVQNPLGLHARPAARLVQTAGRFNADVRVTNLTTGKGPASARSLNAVATLGVLQDHEIEVAAAGPDAAEAVMAIRELAAEDFGDAPAEAEALRAPVVPAVPAEGALAGLPASPGVAVGPARRFRPPDVEARRGPVGEPAEEWAALLAALDAVRAEIRVTRDSIAARAGEQSAAIFDAHLLFLEDEELLAPVCTAILHDHRGAAEAWVEAVDRTTASWRAIDDPYLRARAADVEDLGKQVLRRLAGTTRTVPTLTGPGVLVATDLTPADTAGLDPDVVRGIATALGGPTSHSAVLARSLGIPAVAGLGSDLLEIEEGVTVVLDGEAGTVSPNPDPSEIAQAEARAEAFRVSEAEARAEAMEPAVTRDGTRVEVLANVGKPEDVAAAVAAGAEGIGLLRTEFLFLGREQMPTEQEQEAAYRSMAQALVGRPMILRTLDVGGDKPLPYLPMVHEANPFLGVRGLRLGLARPDLLRLQLRAAVRVAADHPVKVMFPMVTTLEELLDAKQILDEVRREIEAETGVTAPFEVGIMVEVPSAALAADVFAPHVDFFSIGTNDLAQYTLAAERGNERVAGLADALHPAVLRLIRMTTEAAAPFGRPVGVCGELAADPVAVPILVGLGVRELSASPPAVPRIKRAVRAVELEAARGLSEESLKSESAEAVRALVPSTSDR
jgi:phosphoenolpyruvate-protein phosphotransferase/dihydroxyacetone kinase phosphotransfer subunit